MANPWQRIADAFQKDSPDEGGSPEHNYAESYLAELRTNWRETEKTITRTAGLIVGLSVAFELILNNKGSITAFLAIKLTSTTIIEFSLPVIIAYLHYAVSFSFAESEMFRAAHDAIMEKLYPTLSRANGQYPLYPPNSLGSGANRVGTLAPSALQMTAGISGSVRPFLIAFAPPLFVIAAYVQLFARYGLANGILWGSLALAGILLFAGISFLTVMMKV